MSVSKFLCEGSNQIYFATAKFALHLSYAMQKMPHLLTKYTTEVSASQLYLHFGAAI